MGGAVLLGSLELCRSWKAAVTTGNTGFRAVPWGIRIGPHISQASDSALELLRCDPQHGGDMACPSDDREDFIFRFSLPPQVPG